MYDGNQVLRFESKYKAKDLGGLGVELTQRKGTGNYDKDRTQFNHSFVPLTKPTLQEQVYSKLKENKIYYNDGKNTNLLNGAIVTSGKEFFQSLGMKFKASDRIQQVGKNKEKPIYIPDIKSDEDINNLIDYSKKIQKQNSNNKNVIKQKDVLIDELATKVGHLQSENNKLKDGRAIKERDTRIYEQQKTISKQKMVIKEKESIIK